MSEWEILQKAIKKAKKNGWKPDDYIEAGLSYDFENAHEEEGSPFGWYDYEDSLELNTVIFNHDFAKALWGTETKEYKDTVRLDGKIMSTWQHAWMYHLSHMVLAENPIKYLGENI